MMGTPVGAGDFNISIGICLSNRATSLVAVDAQVALAAIEGHVLKGKKSHRISGR
jgi:hypothetical protein